MYTVLAFALLIFVAGLQTPAYAGDGAPPGAAAPRLMVRLDASAHPLTGDVVAHLTPSGGTVVDCALADNGERPDMAAGDGVWTGFAEVAGDRARVTVSAAGWSGDAGDVVLTQADITRRASGERLRQLGLAVVGGKLVAAQGLTDGAPSPAGSSAMLRPRGESGGASRDEAQSDEGSESRGRRHQKTAAEPASNTLWYIAAAIASLSLLGVGALWFRGARRAARLPDGVRRLPELGLFGPGTPALVPGVSQWIVAEADEAALVHHLLQAVAGQRPVLVHAPDAMELPGTQPGAGFRACYAKATELQDAAYDLQEIHPSIAVLLLGAATGSPSGTLEEWTAYIRKDLPILVVVREPMPGLGVAVRCARTDGAWVYSAGS